MYGCVTRGGDLERSSLLPAGASERGDTCHISASVWPRGTHTRRDARRAETAEAKGATLRAVGYNTAA